jgi:hypothetical protein
MMVQGKDITAKWGVNRSGMTGLNVAFAVQMGLFVSPSPPRLKRILASTTTVIENFGARGSCCTGQFRRVEQALGTELSFQRKLRRMLVAATIIGPVALAPEMSSAEGLLDFFANIFNTNLQPPQPTPPARPVVASSGPSFCVRSCDGKYFPLMRGAASPTQMCQAFCPASPTEVFFGSSIDNANAASGERYADSENAFAYRKALRADCTCNGHNPAGLASVDLAMDGSLRSGDALATADGLVAYSGIRVGNDQTPDFTPVASSPGLTPEARARLNDMKVAPARADMAADKASTSEVTRTPLPAATITPKPVPARD